MNNVGGVVRKRKMIGKNESGIKCGLAIKTGFCWRCFGAMHKSNGVFSDGIFHEQVQFAV